MIAELRYLKDRYGIQGVHFTDELAIVNRRRAKELSEKIAPLRLKFDCQARVNAVDREALQALKRAGCIVVGFGIESGSQKILDAMNKRQTVEQIESSMKACRDLELEVKVQLIFGYPGEDAQTLNETVELFRRLRHPGRRFNILGPLPGTPIYEMARSAGFIADEEEYLKSMACDFGGNRIKANFTAFADSEYLARKVSAEKAMRENFLGDLKKRPGEWRRYRIARAVDFLLMQKGRVAKLVRNPAGLGAVLRGRRAAQLRAAGETSGACAICAHQELCKELGVRSY